MFELIEKLADNLIANHYNDSTEVLEKLLTDAKRSKDKVDIDNCCNFLLYVCCQFNFLSELDAVLTVMDHFEIDACLFPKNAELREVFIKAIRSAGFKPNKLMAVAAYHGHLEIVEYLCDVRSANPNATDPKGNSPLHYVVYGDAYLYNHSSIGSNHKKVAKCLLRNGAKLLLKNNKGETAYDKTKWCAPLWVERQIGRRVVTNTGSALYYADQVRPVFEKELARRNTLPTYVIGKKEATPFLEFCRNRASKKYIKTGSVGYGYASLNAFFEELEGLSAEEWEKLMPRVNGYRPNPYSFKFDLIMKQVPNLLKKCATAGIGTILFTYYQTSSILAAISSGAISATLAWVYLSESALKPKLKLRGEREQRAEVILSCDAHHNHKPSFVFLRDISAVRGADSVNYRQQKLESIAAELNM